MLWPTIERTVISAKTTFAQNSGSSKKPIFTVAQFPSFERGREGVDSDVELGFLLEFEFIAKADETLGVDESICRMNYRRFVCLFVCLFLLKLLERVPLDEGSLASHPS